MIIKFKNDYFVVVTKGDHSSYDCLKLTKNLKLDKRDVWRRVPKDQCEIIDEIKDINDVQN